MLYDQSPRKNKAQKGLLASNKWHRIILDEAQIIRNRSAQTSIAAAKLNATHYWSLTGTPVTNTLFVSNDVLFAEANLSSKDRIYILCSGLRSFGLGTTGMILKQI